MAEKAVQLTDHVLPDVPVRQWALSLPHRLRYHLTYDKGRGRRRRRDAD